MNTRPRVARTSRLSAGIVALGAIGGFAVARRFVRRTGPGSFRGQIVVITGGARGLGQALARRFAAEGARLSLLSRTPTQLESARLQLQAAGADVETHVCDVRDAAQVAATIGEILARHGRIDVLVNNAGIIQMAPFEHTADDDYEDSLRTHFWGPLFTIRAVLPAMRARGRGRILNISSIGGRLAVPHLLPYCVGKFALTALSEGLRAELAKDGIVVTTATPGLMRTGSHRNVIVKGRQAEEARWFGAGSATSLTSMRVDRAARLLVEACRQGRATVTPSVQARVASMLHGIAPGLTNDLMGAMTSALLPAPTHAAGGNQPRLSRDLQLGWISRLFPTGAARRHNQPVARGETT